MLLKGKKVAAIIGTVLLPATVAGTLFVASNASYRLLKASDYEIVLNSNNQPTLDNSGDGTMVDEKNVTWEYHNASTNPSGHVTLNADSYFGVSAASEYGITGIESITVTFTGDDLWLLTSVDALVDTANDVDHWSECVILESGVATTAANGWRYIRFYNYSSTVSITSVTIGYGCSGVSGPEDIDAAKASNVAAVSSNITYTATYSDLSPYSDGGEAISFTKNDTVGAKSEITLGLGKKYVIGDVQNSKIEFDMKTSNINYGRTIQMYNDTATLGSLIDSNKATSYKCTPISGDWYHIEVPITTLISTISGITVDGVIKDKPHTDVEKKEFNRIKINAGTCVIDNLRITASPCELGIFNNPTYKPTVGEYYWLKTAWVGVLYADQVTITCSDPSAATQIPITYPDLLFGSPFYLHLEGSGTVTFTVSVTCGYNHRVQSTSFTVTIN